MTKLREALHRCADILADALEDAHEAKAQLQDRAPVAKVRATRAGAGLRAFTLDAPVDELSQRRAEEIMRRKGIRRSGG